MRIFPKCNMSKLTKLWHLSGGEVVSLPLDDKHTGKHYLVVDPPNSGKTWGDSGDGTQVMLIDLASGRVVYVHVSTRAEVHKGAALVLDFVEGA